MIKILVADKLSKVGLDWLAAQEDVETAIHAGLTPEALAEIIGDYDGVIIRSGVKITEQVLVKSGRLKGIARAGVGVDNVDVPCATQRGIIVMNTPDGNTLSTAELTWTLILGLSRKIGLANASLRSGKWERKLFEGTQLAGKTLGVVGLGRIGKAVAKRGIAMQMRVLGYDPFFPGGIDEQSGIERVKDFSEICKRCDYITVHVPKTAETAGMIGAEQIDMMKPTVRLINAARGGIIDPQALLDGLNAGKVAGAALDVFTAEPPASEAEKALIIHDKVLAVPHLGASTEEAQEQVALEAAQQLVEALRGGEVRNAVNAPGFGSAIPEILKPYTELAPRMAAILAGITPGAVRKVEIIFRGAISECNTSPVATYVLQGLFQPHMHTPVNVINAPVLAKQRGVEVEVTASLKVREFANLLEIRVTTEQATRSVIGTIFGNKFPRVISIDGYHMEMRPEGNVVIILNDDRPGALGQYGSVFGKHGINIADLTFSRKKRSGLALVGLNLDQEPANEVMTEVRSMDMVKEAWSLKLPELPFEFGPEE
ncbi:MAG TPA: phosphoglycerate dehydrogenase [Phycisphaerae bacterium]|nr:phosphoglycerate dehydrogenase [Phycisphaerae bacterium]